MLNLLTSGKEMTLTMDLPASDYVNLHYFKTLLEDSATTKSDLDGNITYANEKFLEITGYSQKEVMGKNHNIIRHPDNDDSIFKNLWETIGQGKIWHERILNRNKNGSDFWADSTIIPLINPEDGMIIEYLAIRRDITEFLALQRTIYHQKIKEEEQRKIAEAKDSFLILFTHELKTPLNAIINFSKYLLKHVTAETIHDIPIKKRQQLLEKIESSAISMLENVTQILELSRLKSNKLTYNMGSFNSREAFQEVIDKHQALADQHNVEITIESNCHNLGCNIISDQFRVKQIFANILSNAIKYSNGKVYIKTACDKDSWTLHVEDNGDGIKDTNAVFKLFEQSAGDIKTRSKEGTGVGLTFVKLLCEDLDFTYKLGTSEKLGGLKFTLIKK